MSVRNNVALYGCCVHKDVLKKLDEQDKLKNVLNNFFDAYSEIFNNYDKDTTNVEYVQFKGKGGSYQCDVCINGKKRRLMFTDYSCVMYCENSNWIDISDKWVDYLSGCIKKDLLPKYMNGLEVFAEQCSNVARKDILAMANYVLVNMQR